ncbi:hypothetical protein [Acuticoccus kandeliae]|uniref:hypothetical protein n=1 Tax=Acuticoccus kandeliae TaxID=2073160 RepID=UPI000D3E5D1F|nr:hypothetical protein [Acuticoccus kandeliae]
MIHLDDAAIARLAIDPADMRRTVAEAFRLWHAGAVVAEPKTSLEITPTHRFQSMCAASEALGIAVVKWVGVTPAPPGSTGAGIHAVLVVNDFTSGRPLALMAGNVLTGLRTAAMSAAAADRLADRTAPHTLGFVGCGLQARHHLAAFLPLFPNVTRILATSRGGSRDAFAAWARETHGVDIAVTADPDEVVAASSLLVTTVPSGVPPFLSAEALPAGAFVAAADLGRAFIPATLGAIDAFYTDDLAQEAAHPIVPPPWTVTADLGAIVTDGVPAARPGERRMFVFRGHGVGDLAGASLVRERAAAEGAGIHLADPA